MREILPYNPNLIIAQECEHPSKFTDNFYSNLLLIGDNTNKDLGVFSLNYTKFSLYEFFCENMSICSREKEFQEANLQVFGFENVTFEK